MVLLISTTASAKDIRSGSITIPDNWTISGTVLYKESKQKIGELTSKKSWDYRIGNSFVAAFKAGFFDDPATTNYISDGQKHGIYWICRTAEYDDGAGGFGTWYVRPFWVNGPVLTLYSEKSCKIILTVLSK